MNFPGGGRHTFETSGVAGTRDLDIPGLGRHRPFVPNKRMTVAPAPKPSYAKANPYGNASQEPEAMALHGGLRGPHSGFL